MSETVEIWVNEDRAARHLGVSPNTLRCWRSGQAPGNGRPPPPSRRVGRCVRYSLRELDQWVREGG